MPVFQLKSRVEQNPVNNTTKQTATPGGASDDSSAIHGDGTETTADANLKTLNGTKPTDKDSTIVLDGPLSYLYTKALNIVLAIEDDELIPTDQPVAEKPSMAVYACSMADLDNCNGDYIGKAQSIVKSLNDSGAAAQVLALECMQRGGAGAGAMIDYMGAKGIKVVYGVDHGANTMKNLLKK